MKFLVVFTALVCSCAAGHEFLAYTSLVPGAPIGLDGRVVDTPEVAQAKAEHAAAHLNEKLRNFGAVAHVAPVAHIARLAAAPVISYAAAPLVLPGSPIGLDGRVVDTPEVTLAQAQHAAAHVNEKINLANEAVKSADLLIASPYLH